MSFFVVFFCTLCYKTWVVFFFVFFFFARGLIKRDFSFFFFCTWPYQTWVVFFVVFFLHVVQLNMSFLEYFCTWFYWTWVFFCTWSLWSWIFFFLHMVLLNLSFLARSLIEQEGFLHAVQLNTNNVSQISIRPTGGTLTSTTIRSQSGSESNGNKRILHIPPY